MTPRPRTLDAGGDGHDMDHYADDLAAFTIHLNLKNAVHVGSFDRRRRGRTLLARHGDSRVAKAVLIMRCRRTW